MDRVTFMSTRVYDTHLGGPGCSRWSLGGSGRGRLGYRAFFIGRGGGGAFGRVGIAIGGEGGRAGFGRVWFS